MLVIEFARNTSVVRERDRPSALPIVGNGPPGTFVIFPGALRVSLPTDQIVSVEDSGGQARVMFGGMDFVGLERGQLVFRRIHEMLPEHLLSPARSHVMRLDPSWVVRVVQDGREVWARRVVGGGDSLT